MPGLRDERSRAVIRGGLMAVNRMSSPATRLFDEGDAEARREGWVNSIADSGGDDFDRVDGFRIYGAFTRRRATLTPLLRQKSYLGECSTGSPAMDIAWLLDFFMMFALMVGLLAGCARLMNAAD